MNGPGMIARANEIISRSTEAFVGAMDEGGYPHVSQRSLIYPRTIAELFFSSDRGGKLHGRLERDPRSSLCFSHGESNITLIGRTVEVTDGEVKKAHWLDWFGEHFPGGPEGPEFTLFRFRTERISLWINRESLSLPLEEILTPRSGCGLLCSLCDFRKSQDCSGCLAGKGEPFWGQCPVAACSRKKGLTHCGECPSLPCPLLEEFSCGEGEHCDDPRGARIGILRMWRS